MRKALIALALMLGGPAVAEIDGHGPDAWRVVGVASGDTLNMRMGPGTNYLVIDRLHHTERRLRLVTCVPLLIQPYYSALTDAQRAALPQRWCLVQSADFAKAGWVAQRFLAEDGSELAPPPAADDTAAAPLTATGDALLDGAQSVVQALYSAFAASQGHADNPFAPGNAASYFFADLVPDLSGHGTDLLFDAQDFQGQVTLIAPDADRPMFRGMITINVDFTNFGQSKRAVFLLRPDITRPDAPLRIFRVEHDGWSYP